MQNAIAEHWPTVARLYKNHMDQIFGAIFGPHFWTRFWAKVLDQIWITILVQFLSQNFLKIGKKISLARKIPPSQAEKNARAPSENHNAEASPACTHCCQRKCMWPLQVDRTVRGEVLT